MQYIVGHQVDFQAWEIEKQCKQGAGDKHSVQHMKEHEIPAQRLKSHFPPEHKPT